MSIKLRNMETSKFVLAFDGGAKGERYINDTDDKFGTQFLDEAKVFDTIEEAKKYNDEKGYICEVVEMIPEAFTYDVVFEDDENSNSKGFKETIDYCKSYIANNNGTNNSYFAEYKGGTVVIVCNETDERLEEIEIY